MLISLIFFHDRNDRYSYEERILRFFALRPMELKGTFKLMMNSFMEVHANDDEEVLKKYKNQYNSLIELIKVVLGEGAFFRILISGRNSMVQYTIRS